MSWNIYADVYELMYGDDNHDGNFLSNLDPADIAADIAEAAVQTSPATYLAMGIVAIASSAALYCARKRQSAPQLAVTAPAPAPTTDPDVALVQQQMKFMNANGLLNVLITNNTLFSARRATATAGGTVNGPELTKLYDDVVAQEGWFTKKGEMRVMLNPTNQQVAFVLKGTEKIPVQDILDKFSAKNKNQEADARAIAVQEQLRQCFKLPPAKAAALRI